MPRPRLSLKLISYNHNKRKEALASFPLGYREYHYRKYLKGTGCSEWEINAILNNDI